MNKIKEDIDKIKLSDVDKNRIYHNIIAKKQKNKLPVYVLRFALILIVFTFLIGTSYGLVKAFKLDDKFKNFFDLNGKDIDNIGIDGNDVDKTFDFDNAKITVRQTIIDEKEAYILIDIEGKNDLIYLHDYYVNNQNGFNEEGFSLISTEGNINSYLLDFSINTDIDYKKEITIHLIDSDNNTYDITFDLTKNNVKEKRFLFDDVVYTKNDLVAKIKEIKVTPFRVMILFEYNKDIDTLSDDDLTDIQNNLLNSNNDKNSFIGFDNGRKMLLRLDANSSNIEDTFSYYDKYERFVDIDTIKCIVINGQYFNLKEDNNTNISEGLFLKNNVLTYYKNGKETSFGTETNPKEHIYYDKDKIYFYNYKHEENNNSVIISYFDIKEQKEVELMTINNVINIPYIDDEYVFTYTYTPIDDNYQKYHQIIKRINLNTKEEHIIIEEDTVNTEEDIIDIEENKATPYPINPTIIKDNNTYYISIDTIENNKKSFSIYKVTEDLKTELLTTHYNRGSFQTYMYLDNNKLYYAAYEIDIEFDGNGYNPYYKLYSYDLTTKKINEEISNINALSPVFVANNTIIAINEDWKYNYDLDTYILYLKKDDVLYKINLDSKFINDYVLGITYFPGIKILSDNTLILNLSYGHYYRINIDDLIKSDTYTITEKDLINWNTYDELTMLPLDLISSKTN